MCRCRLRASRRGRCVAVGGRRSRALIPAGAPRLARVPRLSADDRTARSWPPRPPPTRHPRPSELPAGGGWTSRTAGQHGGRGVSRSPDGPRPSHVRRRSVRSAVDAAVTAVEGNITGAVLSARRRVPLFHDRSSVIPRSSDHRLGVRATGCL